MTTDETAQLPCGLVVPSDIEAAREAIAEALEQQAAEARANEFIARVEAERLESPVI